MYVHVIATLGVARMQLDWVVEVFDEKNGNKRVFHPSSVGGALQYM